MGKIIEIDGCVEVPNEVTVDDFLDLFIEFVESHDWYFGGGVQELPDVADSDGSDGSDGETRISTSSNPCTADACDDAHQRLPNSDNAHTKLDAESASNEDEELNWWEM